MKSLALVFICAALLSSLESSAFELPDITNFFSILGSQQQASDTNEIKIEEKSRQKRQSKIGDESAADPWQVLTSGIPVLADGRTPNSRYMATLGNGHIGTTVYDSALYMEGVYKGSGSETHRAKIPAMIMTRVNFSRSTLENTITRKFNFNAKYGIFTEQITTRFAAIEHSMYMHQKYMRLFVVHIVARKTEAGKNQGGGVIRFNFPLLEDSEDLTFTRRGMQQDVYLQASAPVTGEGVSETVHIFWTETVPSLSLTGSREEFDQTFLMTVDTNEGDARSELSEVLSILNSAGGWQQILREHKETWDRVWDHGRIEVVGGNPTISKLANFAQYYLLSSMPAAFPSQGVVRSHVYEGVGRSGLAKGTLGRDYQGHIMWDNEMYIQPAVLLFHPSTVKQLLRYRADTASQAESNAARYSAKGYHYPFQSAVSGRETSPDVNTCPDCSWKKYHVTGAVAWSLRQYYSATRDNDIRTDPLYNGCDITREIAKFFADRAVYSPEDGRYNMRDMTGPDEGYPGVDNNAYTLVLASLAIHWGRYFACLCQRSESDEVPDEWVQKALLLNLPFDNVQRTHAQFEGYNPEVNRETSQADTIMLTYPLRWNMSNDIMKHDLQAYEARTSADTPAMTWSFFAAGWKMVNEDFYMQGAFQKSYQDYVVEPFKIWTEYKEVSGSSETNPRSAVNFLPGMGGFLQSLIYGFAGINIRPQMLEFQNPQTPPGVAELRLHRLKYLGSVLDIVIEQSSRTTIRVVSADEKYPLVLKLNDSTSSEIQLVNDHYEDIQNARNGFFIFSNNIEGCEHPRDYIYMPWGYSPYVDSSTNLQCSKCLLMAGFVLWVMSRVWT